jgi:Flp pilus assembly protein TadB
MANRPLSAADDQHLHHQLKRAVGVKGAVLILYAIGSAFAILGVAVSMGRSRDVYVIALVFASFIIVTAIKIAQRQRIEQQAVTPAPRRAVPARRATAPGKPVGSAETSKSGATPTGV